MKLFKHNMYSLIFLLSFAVVSAISGSQIFDYTDYERPMSISVIQALIERMNEMETREESLIKAIGELKREHQIEIDGLKREIVRQNDELKYLQKKMSGQARLLSHLARRFQPSSSSPRKESSPGSSAAISVSYDRSAEDKRKKSIESTGNTMCLL